MPGRTLSLRSREDRLAWLGAALTLALLLFAYRSLVWSVFSAPTHTQIEGWLFRPVELPSPLILAFAAWLAWRRRERFLALAPRTARAAALLWFASGGALFVWAHRTGSADLLLPSLAAQLLGFAAAARGAEGCRVMALPALALLFGMRIPAPLQDEMVWRLQLWTTSVAAAFVQSLGGQLTHGGVTLRAPGHSFQVIDGCSGFRGILILTLVALLVRELFAASGRRLWLLLPLAPVLGFALNIVRVAYVATSPDPEALAGAEGDHTPQGIAVLLVGTALLYALGRALARDESPRGAAAASTAAPVGTAATGLATLSIALLAALSLGVPRYQRPPEPLPRAATLLPDQGGGFVSEGLTGDPLFFGSAGALLHRRYLPAGRTDGEEAIEVFVGTEIPAFPATSSLLSSKIHSPGPDWDVVREDRATLWLLQREARRTTAARPPGGEHAVVYTWRPGDLGIWRESLRSLLSLDASPLRRERPRRVVRLIAFSPHDGALALDRARQRLDHFIAVFREPLAEL